MYDDNVKYYCFNMECKLGFKIDKIIEDLIENDVYKRITIDRLIEIYNL